MWWGKTEGRDHLGDPGVDGRIILRWIGGGRRRYGGEERYIQGCGGKNLRERATWETQV